MKLARSISIMMLASIFLAVLLPQTLASTSIDGNSNIKPQTAVDITSAFTSQSVRFGEDATFTEMNFHRAWTEVPAPSNPGSSGPNTLECWSTGNSAHTLVSTSASENEYRSGNAFAMVGVEFLVEGEAGQSSEATITVDFSYNAMAQLINGGGTADTDLLYPNGVEHRALCTTWGYPRTETRAFSGDESITFTWNIGVGGPYSIYLYQYAHADVNSVGVASAFCDVTIHSIKIEYSIPPVASFKSLNIVEGKTLEAKHMVGGTIVFNASDSYDPDNSSAPNKGIDSYVWDFGDGTPAVTTQTPIVTRVFLKPEVFTVTLNVVDHDNLESNFSETLDLSLIPGDLIFIRSRRPWNIPFNWLGEIYTHVGMYVGKINGVHYMIESTVSPPPTSKQKGVQLTAFARWAIPYETYVDSIRVQVPDADIRNRAVAWALSKIGKPYDLLSAVLGMKQLDASSSRWFGDSYYCSELIWAAYYRASNGAVDLSFGEPGRVSPDTICFSAGAILGWHHEHYPA